MSDRNILIAGVGGQGVLLISTLLAQTALKAGYDVKTNEVHGMAQRGGSVIAQVRFGKKVYSPLVWEGTVDLLIALESGEALRYAHYLKPSATAIISTQIIVPVSVSSGKALYPENIPQRLISAFPHLYTVDTPALAEKVGNRKTANMIALGAASTVLPELNQYWEEIIASVVPQKYRQVNMKAFEAGRECV